MYQSKKGIKAFSSLEVLASVGLVLGLSSWALGQNCGTGDSTSGEPCLVTDDTDDTNGGCNSDPNVFEPAVINGSIDGTISTYSPSRDTDWYLLSPAQMAEADADNNGIIVLSHSASSQVPVHLFIVALGDPLCGAAAVIGTTGYAGPADGSSCTGGEPSRAIISIADHPNGIAYWIGPGEAGGGAIYDGYPCSGANDYMIDMEVIELPTACNYDSGPCNLENKGPGCNDPECCNTVCEIDAACCESQWDQICADLAIEDGCALGLGAPSLIATGPDNSVDGYLDLFADGFGSEAAAYNGGPAWLDQYNPVGGALSSPGFSTTTFLFMGGTERQALTLHSGGQVLWTGGTMSTAFTAANVLTDENKDGVDDQMVSQFEVDGALQLDVICTQSVESLLSLGGDPYANWTLSYEITNNGGAAEFEIVRWIDVDAAWAGDYQNDVVGTGTNNGTECDRYIYQGEAGASNFSIALSSNQPDTEYVGSKFNWDVDCDGPIIPFANGTVNNTYWATFGMPDGWSNLIADVGYDSDGESGTAPDDGCGNAPGNDGSIGLFATISMAANETTTVTFVETYGANTPNAANCEPGGCIWDLDGSGAVSTGDLLILFSQWGTDGTADFDESGLVGTGDLLILFVNWGPCP